MEKRKYHGPIKDKERTKQKLLEAVGEIIRSEGYTGLGVNKVAKLAGVDKKLIYDYYTNLDTLVTTYIRQKDYWLSFLGEVADKTNKDKAFPTAEMFTSILTGHLNYFAENKEMQQIVRWELSEKNPIVSEICQAREIIGEQFLSATDGYFQETTVDLRAISALLVGGIYHLILHSNTKNSLFCGLDISTAEGKDRITNALEWIISQAYLQVDPKK
ncbi:AcrR family transcriptional regulator [Pedobacter sp. CG_S7]|uniref:TetR/AcrR family transcriptional regulator n=1 Tax=Pedobacter sp. CG_S7 TaxID=3143930 RepID=UPI003391BB18